MEKITAFFDSIDLAKLVPEMDTLLGKVQTVTSLALMIGPVLMLILGLWYFFLPPKEANHRAGFRTWFGMGSVQAWRFTQRLAGIVWGVLGLVLTLVMVSLTGKFAGLDVAEALGLAAKYVLLEAVLALVSSLVINTVVMIRFTYDGEYRRERAGK